MKRLLCHVLWVSMLVISVEGAADIAKEGHPHSDQSGSSIVVDAAESGDSDEDHCERCCHGHLSSLTGLVSGQHTPPLPLCSHGCLSTTFIKFFGPAPPTPPPTA